MKNPEPKPLGKLFYSGLILIPIMISLLVFTSLNRNNNSFFDDGVGGFFVNYLISLGYLLFILFTNESFFKFGKIDKRLIIVSLLHFSISCFTLNNSIVLFAQFPIWVKIYLVISYSAFLGLCFIERIPKAVRYMVFFFLGSGLIITSYFAIYLAPIYHISLIGLLFFGLSIHILIPLFMSIAILVIYYKIRKSKIEKAIFSLGIIIPFLITSLFLYKWNHLQEVIHQSNSSIITRPNNDLPEWVLLCQDMPADDFSNKIIKGHLVFDTFRNMWGGFGNTRFNEVKRHDPLMNIGMAIMKDLNLDGDTRVKILKSQFNARHLTQRKLWSEHNLGCIEVLNNTQVFPEYRIAYTEKIISIRNFSQWEGNQQEASFTFYLPEGSVATSLSHIE